MDKNDIFANSGKDFKEIMQILKELESSVKSRYNAEIIGLFGSYARGEQKQGSDVDILVRFYEGATLFDFVGLAEFLEEKLDLKVDVVSERAIRVELKDQILREVVSI